MFEENIPLAPYTNFKIGGRAQFFYTAQSIAQIETAILEAKKQNLNIFVLGGGTNILVPDEGFSGLVLKPAINSLVLEAENRVRVAASASMEALLQFTVEHALAGLEWAGGLPGSVGGAIYGNAGAFGGEIKDNLLEARVLDISSEAPEIKTYSNFECRFSYRMSAFKERVFQNLNSSSPTYAPPKDIILEAVFQLTPGKQAEIQAGIDEKKQYRIDRQPLEYPNIGSIHKNVDVEVVPPLVLEKYQQSVKTDPFPVLPTARLIHDAGLKGKTIGGAQVSEKHPNFIINLHNAKAKDVRALAEFVRKTVQATYNIALEREVIFL